MGERWLPVVGYEGFYEISDLGRVRSLKAQSDSPRYKNYKGVILKGIPTKPGYIVVTLRKNGTDNFHGVHVLVARAFHPDSYKPGLLACHENGIKSDNRAGNVRWDSYKGNAADTLVHGTRLFGERHPNSTITDAQREEIRQSKNSSRYLGRKFGISKTTVLRYKRREDAWLNRMIMDTFHPRK